LAEGDARGAITKFEQALEYAPKWGCIQIAWGSALKRLRRDVEAMQKFTSTQAVELVPSERALLTAAMQGALYPGCAAFPDGRTVKAIPGLSR